MAKCKKSTLERPRQTLVQGAEHKRKNIISQRITVDGIDLEADHEAV